jgi:WhiB family redox-sensing transcriptional regulator
VEAERQLQWTSEPWMMLGACRGLDPEIFFPRDGLGVLGARRICQGCQVRLECLEYALRHRIEHGVWGGASERERKRIRRAPERVTR